MLNSKYRVAQKCPEHSHGIVQQCNRNEQAKKHMCNEQTSSNMSRNFLQKHFRISHDTIEIVLPIIIQFCKQFIIYVIARMQATPQCHVITVN